MFAGQQKVGPIRKNRAAESEAIHEEESGIKVQLSIYIILFLIWNSIYLKDVLQFK